MDIDVAYGNVPEQLPPSPVMAALDWFYDRLVLEDVDADQLWEKRGLTTATAVAMGYRSGSKKNKDILLEMAEHFPPQVLLDAGLWTAGSRAGDPPKPNPQLHGLAIVERRDPATGKKVRDADGEVVKDLEWGDPGPMLIPYFNRSNQLVHIRPHKGMLRDKTPHLYAVRPPGRPANGPRPKYAVITESEFKAAAVWQVMGEDCTVAGLPGITMAKLLQGDVEEWLETTETRMVIIAYDNEDKSNPALASYQEDKWKRYPAQIWARFLAARLSREGYDARVCTLPAEWRDEKAFLILFEPKVQHEFRQWRWETPRGFRRLWF